MGLFSKAGGDELMLVFDIGSSSVGGALFFMQKNKIPKIVYAIREPILTEDKIDFERFLVLTAKALETVANKISKQRFGGPSRIFCVLSSAWYVSQTRVVHLEKSAPFVFTDKLADSLIQKEVSVFEEEYLKKYASNNAKVRPIELKNIKTVLNGYETADPINQKARDVEMTIFVAMSGEQVLKKFEEVIHKHFHHPKINFTSFIMTSFATVRDMYVHQDNFLLIDIGGEVTDISMIKKNILRESVSYPMGRNFIIRSIATALSITLDEAKSFISLSKAGHAAPEVEKKIEPYLTKAKNEWLRKFQNSLANISTDISIPAVIFIAIDQEFADFFGEIIRTEQFNQYTLTERKFEIMFLNNQALHGAAEFEENVVRDPFLIIESIYINRFLNKT